MKHEIDEEESFLSESRGSEELPTSGTGDKHRSFARAKWCYPRLLLEIGMAAAIVYLLLRAPPDQHIRKTPVPQFPRKIYTFHTDPEYTNEEMFFNSTATRHTLHNWIPLSSESRGYVVIPEASRYDLPTPYTVALDRVNDGPGYMMTVFHQLHCLSYLTEHFQQGYAGTALSTEVAHHAAHCFSYLRQGLMCNADTTLEGKTEAGPGEGSEHECVDYDVLLKWANDNSAYKWRNALLPDEATL